MHRVANDRYADEAVVRCRVAPTDVLKKHAVEVSHDWWTRFKTGYYRFVDDNVKDNAGHEPWSCHQSPPGNKRKN